MPRRIQAASSRPSRKSTKSAAARHDLVRDLSRILLVVAVLDDTLVAPHRREGGFVFALVLARREPCCTRSTSRTWHAYSRGDHTSGSGRVRTATVVERRRSRRRTPRASERSHGEISARPHVVGEAALGARVVERVVADEARTAARVGSKGCGSRREPVHADTEHGALGSRRTRSRRIRAPGTRPRTRRDIGRPAVARPDHRRARRAQRRQRCAPCSHVVVGDVAEHAADEHEVGRHRAFVRRRRVPASPTSTSIAAARWRVRSRRGRGRARRAGRARRPARGWSASTPRRSRPSPAHMLITRIGPGGAASSASRMHCLHDRQPARKRAVGLVVRAMPLVPVAAIERRMIA